MRHQMQETLNQTADEVDSQSDSGCRRLSIRCLIESLQHPLSERESLASAV